MRLQNIDGLERERILASYPEVFAPDYGRRAATILTTAGIVGLFVFGLVWLGFSPGALLRGVSRLGIILQAMFPPTAGQQLPVYITALGQTLSIAFLGTMLAAALAFPLAFFAAKNVAGMWVVRFLTKRSFDVMRGIDTLIWALIFINVVGLGPFSGILAVAMSDLGSFGKLFSEAIETASRKQVEGVLSTGASKVQEVRFAIIPQVLPIFLSQVLYYFESNVRSATVIGIVGAGGIGLYLSNEISQQSWDHVSFIILMILGTVAAIDFVSARVRRSIIGTPVRA
ncbi:phosphonate ABC transporter, permease protein PhnE [Tardiphaga sp. 172_B4_N1_3]|uniref:phosphonate ABC transporter, permease protein PhnE n=1 Tax=Tardiphaga sp. 172_B4_N1_3 TaxID=3240787 RepID=UPI003F8B2D4C